MRECTNESVTVHETTGDLATSLREAADLVEGHEGHANVHTLYDVEEGYVVTVYLH